MVTNIPEEGIISQIGEVLLEGVVRSLYEKENCGRGNAENMIKQMMLDLRAGRPSCSWMAANRMRLWFSSLAYLLLERMLEIGLEDSPLAGATLLSVRLRLLKVAAVVQVIVRRVHGALLGFPLAGCLSTGGLVLAKLRAAKNLLNKTATAIKQRLKTGFHDPGGKSTI